MLNEKIVDTIKQLRVASRNMPIVWDGRNAVLEMKNSLYKQWKQKGWIEWYFKFLCEKHFDTIIDMPGKKFGFTQFDAFCEISWDFKIDSVKRESYSVIANDAEAVVDTIGDYGYYGMILAIGDMECDDKKTSFKKWHDELRGEVSKYDTYKINSGIMSRTRKTVFILEEIHFICFNGETLHQCCGLFQDGFGETDSNRPKRKEIVIDINEIPNVVFVATVTF